MPVNVVTCPSCGVTLKPKTPVPEGTRLKCPKCSTVFVVQGDGGNVPPTLAAPPKVAAPKPAAPTPPAAEDDIPEVTEIIDDEADGAEGEGAPAKPKKKAIPMWMWLVGGGVGLFVLCGCCGGPIGYFAMYGIPGFGSASVTQANYDKIKLGASEADVTAFMGTPTAKQSADDILKSMPFKPSKPPTDLKALTWKGGGDDVIAVTFVKDKAVLKSARLGMLTESEGNPLAAFGQ